MPTTVDKFTSSCSLREIETEFGSFAQHAIIFLLVRFREKYKRWLKEIMVGQQVFRSPDNLADKIDNFRTSTHFSSVSKSILTLERNYAIGFSKLLPMSQTNIQVLRNSHSSSAPLLPSPQTVSIVSLKYSPR